MSGVSLPVTRPSGRGLLVGSATARAEAAGWLRNLGCGCMEMDDPYAAMAELAARPLAYTSLVLSINTIFREELLIISAVKRRFVHVEIWLTRAEGRASIMDEAMRLGADGFIAEDGLHRLPPPTPAEEVPDAASEAANVESDRSFADPVLTAEELRALLDDPTIPDASRV